MGDGHECDLINIAIFTHDCETIYITAMSVYDQAIAYDAYDSRTNPSASSINNTPKRNDTKK